MAKALLTLLAALPALSAWAGLKEASPLPQGPEAPKAVVPGLPTPMDGLALTALIPLGSAAPVLPGTLAAAQQTALKVEVLLAANDPQGTAKAVEEERAAFDQGRPAPQVSAGLPAAPAAPSAAAPLSKWLDAAKAPLSVFTNRPSNNRRWSLDNAVLASAEFSGDKVTVRNVRNFTYRSTTEYTPAYYDKTYDLRRLDSVDFVFEPFSRFGTVAHTFLTFGFKDGAHLSISVEIRKVPGVSFSPWKGFFNNYELIYVIADERDVIGLRANYRKNPVYLYPIRAPQDKLRAAFVDMLERANKLRERPEFYNSLTNTCLSNILVHYNKLADRPVRLYNPRVLLTGFSDRLAYGLGLIDTTLSLEEARRRYRINERAAGQDANPDFSRRIREEGVK